MDKTFGRRLRALRLHAGLSATTLAGDALSVATISRLEHGAMEPSLATLRYLAGRLDCTPADLLRPEREAARQALATIEACLLLDRPLQARTLAFQAIDRLEGEGDGDEETMLRDRLRWSATRAEAALEPTRGPELLRGALAQATAVDDDWSLARLTVAWATATAADGALPLLLAALNRLPDVAATADAPADQLVRAQLQLLLARGQEREGARETAQGLYRQATIAAASLRLERLAGILLPAQTTAQAGLSMSRSPIARQQPAPALDVTPPLALAIVVAARRAWTSAMLALVRLDVRARRPAAAAQRLAQVQAAGGLDVLASSEWSAAFTPTDQSGPIPPLIRALEGVSLPPPERQQALADLSVADAYLQAGKLDEAERLAAIVATSLVAAPEAARRIWLRLALAWADAGQAPPAAQALRAAQDL